MRQLTLGKTWSARYEQGIKSHYTRDLFKKLQELKQGIKYVDEYFKEMETSMMRANVEQSEEQTMARFMNGLNYPIKRIVEFQPYTSLMELVHQATKAERQVADDIKYNSRPTARPSRPTSPPSRQHHY